MPPPDDTLPDAGFQRARSPERKAQRRAALLAAAAELVDDEGPEAVALAAIAARAGVVKSGVYRYFESREELLARLLIEEFDAAAAALEAELERRGPSSDPVPLAAALARAFAERPRLCRLIAVFATVLERNISVERLTEIKRESARLAARVGEAAARAFPDLPRDRWPGFLTASFALVAGLWPLANMPPHVRAAKEAAGYEGVEDFEGMCAESLAAMLRGMAAGAG